MSIIDHYQVFAHSPPGNTRAEFLHRERETTGIMTDTTTGMTRLLHSENGISYQVYGDDGSEKNTLSKRLITLALAINAVALILVMSVVVVSVTLIISLVTEEKLIEDPFKKLNGYQSNISRTDSQDNEEEDLSLDEAFGEILSICPLIIISSLFGVYAARKSSGTGIIVFYWMTLTGTLLISTYVTSKFVEYEDLFTPKEEDEVMTPIEAVSRLIILIGSLEMMSAVIVTVAKYQKKRVAVKEPSLPDFSPSLLTINRINHNEPGVVDSSLPPDTGLRHSFSNPCTESHRHPGVNLFVNRVNNTASNSAQVMSEGEVSSEDDITVIQQKPTLSHPDSFQR